LRALITELKPIPAPGPTTPPSARNMTTTEVVQKRTLKLPRARLDVDLDELGRAHIGCDHPALVMEQVPRHVDPGEGWSGVPGIYVRPRRQGPPLTLLTSLRVKSTSAATARWVAYKYRPAVCCTSGRTEVTAGNESCSTRQVRHRLATEAGRQPIGGNDGQGLY
jgi:hypothetical protein